MTEGAMRPIKIWVWGEARLNQRAGTVFCTRQFLLFEFKLNGSAEAALAQIRTSAYYERYQAQGKALHLVGVNFSTRKRNVIQWVKA
jgi:hypothetical protein